MHRKGWKTVERAMNGAALLLLVASASAWAFGLGTPGDGYVDTVQTSATGLGLPLFVISGVGILLAKMETAFGMMLSGYINYFVAGIILGGLAEIGGQIGLTSGAML
jgi:hypothetical protein